ncbi:MAG: hypothetical protein PHD43_01735 [Methylococcales bacterium]|nr:hypothetical protein [Methylococcales bacterium]
MSLAFWLIGWPQSLRQAQDRDLQVCINTDLGIVGIVEAAAFLTHDAGLGIGKADLFVSVNGFAQGLSGFSRCSRACLAALILASRSCLKPVLKKVAMIFSKIAEYSEIRAVHLRNEH